MGYAGFLVGPLLIGGAATQVGLPAALAIPALLALFVALSAPALRPARGEPGPPPAAPAPAAPPAPAAAGDDRELAAESEVPLHFRTAIPDHDQPPTAR